MSLKDLKQILDDAEIEFSEAEISMVFGMSKQTVINDNDEKGQAALLRMTFVEFLEFIGRLAVVKFLETEMEELPLGQKIAYILDDLFAVIGA